MICKARVVVGEYESHTYRSDNRCIVQLYNNSGHMVSIYLENDGRMQAMYFSKDDDNNRVIFEGSLFDSGLVIGVNEEWNEI